MRQSDRKTSKLDLDFSRAKEIKGKSLHTLFSSAVRSRVDLDPKSLHIGAFEAFVVEVK